MSLKVCTINLKQLIYESSIKKSRRIYYLSAHESSILFRAPLPRYELCSHCTVSLHSIIQIIDRRAGEATS